jgi:hypothetical protein
MMPKQTFAHNNLIYCLLKNEWKGISEYEVLHIYTLLFGG